MEREGDDGGAGMMQCLATGVCARTRRGHRWWWEVRGVGEERKEGGAPAPRSQRPQRLSFLNLSAQERLVCPPPITSNLLLHKDSHFPGPSQLMGTEALEPLKVSISPTWIDISSFFK